MWKLAFAGLFVVVIGCGGDPAGPATECVDNDLDGVTNCDGDCDDDNALATPGANEICGDNADNNCDGAADDICPGGIGTFVSTLFGDDTYPGTIDQPVKTIGKGIANAMTIGGDQSVIVAQGTYVEKVTLVPGVDLLGGHQCDATTCTWDRDIVVYASKVMNTDSEGVLAGAGVTQATLVSGFEIVGLDGVASAAAGGSIGVTLSGGSPTLRGNKIFGGNVIISSGGGSDRSIGVLLRSTTDPQGALIENNEIIGGAAPGGSAGVAFEGTNPATSLATITANVIRGGAARRSSGVIAIRSAAGTVISNNDITAGNSTGGMSSGIEFLSPLTIDRNRINVDRTTTGTCTQQTQWCAGILSFSGTATITNNIVFGPKANRATAVFLGEFEVAAGQIILNGNYLNGGGSGPTSIGTARNESAAVVVSIGICTMCGFNGFVGRIRNNILDGGDNAARFGVREDPSAGRTIKADALEANLFTFSVATGRADALYREVRANGTAQDHTTLATLHMMTMPPASKNLTGDPMIDTTFHISPSSPCMNTGVATEAPATDFDMEPRPGGAGVEIGPDELP